MFIGSSGEKINLKYISFLGIFLFDLGNSEG